MPGRPLPKSHFGPNGIRIRFNNGSSVVAGYIVKPLGTYQFIVTADGNTTYVVRMTNTPEEAASPPPGYFTIDVNLGSSNSFVKSITKNRITSSSGQTYLWTLGAASAGPVVIPKFTDSALTVPPAPSITSSAAISVGDLEVLNHSLTADQEVTWAIDGGSDRNFKITGSTLQWFTGTGPSASVPEDSDKNNTYVVKVKATSVATGLSSTQDVTVSVASILITNATVAENTSTGTTIGTLSVLGGGGPWTYSFVGGQNAGGRVAISGANLQTTSTAFDYETATSYNITVQATNGTTTYTRVFTINVTNVLEVTLGNILVSTLNWDYAAATGTTLSALTGKTSGSTLSLSDPSGTLAISGTNLTKTATAFASDGASVVFSIIETHPDATQKTHGPFTAIASSGIQLSASTVAENTATGTTIGVLSTPGTGPWTYSFVSSQNAGGRVAISGSNLQTTSTAFNYETATSYDVVIQSTNGTTTLQKTFTITVTNVLEAATLVDLTLSSTSWANNPTVDSDLATINNKATGSTVTIIPNDGRVYVSGSTLKRGSTPWSAGVFSFSLRETLSDSPNSPYTTNLSATIAAPSAGTVEFDPAKSHPTYPLFESSYTVVKRQPTATGNAYWVAGLNARIGPGEKRGFDFYVTDHGFGRARFGLGVAGLYNPVTASTLGDDADSVCMFMNGNPVGIRCAGVNSTGPTAGSIPGWWRYEVDTVAVPNVFYVQPAGQARQGPFPMPKASIGASYDIYVNLTNDSDLWWQFSNGDSRAGSPALSAGYSALVAPTGGNIVQASTMGAILAGMGLGKTVQVAAGNYSQFTLSNADYSANPCTVVAADPANPPKFAGLRVSNCKGILLQELIFNDINNVGNGTITQIESASRKITLYKCEIYYWDIYQNGVSGDRDGNGVLINGTSMPYGMNIRDCFDISLLENHFHDLGGGVQCNTNNAIASNEFPDFTTGPKNIISGNTFEDILADDAQKHSREHNVIITNNFTCNLTPLADPSAHFDICQFLTTNDTRGYANITYTDNFYVRGSGAYAQGNPFMGHESIGGQLYQAGEAPVTGSNPNGYAQPSQADLDAATLWYKNVYLARNTNIGGQFSGTSIGGGDGRNYNAGIPNTGLVIEDNYVQAFTDVGCGIVYSSCLDVRLRRNLTCPGEIKDYAYLSWHMVSTVAENVDNQQVLPVLTAASQTSPTVNIAQGNAAGVVLQDLQALMGSGWTFSIGMGRNAGGRVAISGTNLVTTSTPFSRARYLKHNVLVVGTNAGVSKVARIITIQVQP